MKIGSVGNKWNFGFRKIYVWSKLLVEKIDWFGCWHWQEEEGCLQSPKVHTQVHTGAHTLTAPAIALAPASAQWTLNQYSCQTAGSEQACQDPAGLVEGEQ